MLHIYTVGTRAGMRVLPPQAMRNPLPQLKADHLSENFVTVNNTKFSGLCVNHHWQGTS
jgi:hypothetical protein